MNTADRSELLQVLQGRCDTIADNWYQAIARTSDVPYSAAKVRQRLGGLAAQVIAFLLTNPLKHGRAEAIGAALARLDHVEPKVLGRTQELLAQQLVQGLPADQVVALQPRLAALLGGLAAGFFQQAREAILTEQEQIWGALIGDLQRAEEALRKAREVERRVQERTGELAVVNKRLRREIAERKRMEEALRRAYDELERRVERRTAELAMANEQLRRLAQQIVSAQEEERQRLSRALHDEAGQALTALKINLELIGEDLPAEFGSLRQRICGAATLADATMEQIRLLAQDLRPPALDTVGLNPTLEGFCRDFSQRTGLSIDYLGLEAPMLPEAVNICLYRFLQEALTNVAKHACAKQVCVALRYDADEVTLSVEDDGRGFDGQARLSVSGWPMGIGLLGMQERLESLGGRLAIESQPGQGTRLMAHLPASIP